MPGTKHRVVVDTNLWISFLLTRNLERLDKLFSSEDFILLVSAELLNEITEVALRPKFRKYFEPSDLADLLISLRDKAELITIKTAVSACRDAKDNFLLALALDGKATHVLTGDKDLLVMHPFEGIQIVTMTDYLG